MNTYQSHAHQLLPSYIISIHKNIFHVRASPVQVLEQIMGVVVGPMAVFFGTGVLLEGHQETGCGVDIAPGVVGDIDELKLHSMQVDGVGGGPQVVHDKLHACGVLGDIQDGAVVGAALVFGVQGRGGGTSPGLTTTVDVHVPAAFGQWPVGGFFVQRSLEPQRDVEPVLLEDKRD